MGEIDRTNFRRASGICKCAVNMHLYFFGIIILPMLIGMVMILYLEAKMIEYYFRLMIENMSSRIQGQASIIQTEMLLTNKYYLGNYYKPELADLISTARLVASAASLVNITAPPNIISTLKAEVLQKRVRCFESANINDRLLQGCLDINQVADYGSAGTNTYRINLGNTMAILNGDFNARNKRDQVLTWQATEPFATDLSVILAATPFVSSLAHNRLEKTYSKTRFGRPMMYITGPNGVMGVSYFNYEFFNGWEIPKSDCPTGINDALSGNIKYDPRCRDWHKNTLELSCRYLKALPTSVNTLDLENNLFPLIVNPVTAPSSTPNFTITTISTLERGTLTADCKNMASAASKSFIIAKDIYLNYFTSMVAANYAKAVNVYLDYMDMDDANTKTKIDQLKASYTAEQAKGTSADYLNWLKSVSSLTNDAYRFYFLRLKSNLEYDIFWDSVLQDFYDITSTKSSTWTPLVKAEMDFISAFIKANITFTIDPKLIKKITTPMPFPVVKPDGGITNKTVSVTVQSIGYPDASAQKYYELFKLVFIFPDYVIADRFTKLISDMGTQITKYSLIAGILMMVTLLIGSIFILLFSKTLVQHLSATIGLAEKVEKGEAVVQDKNEKTDMLNYEVLQSKNALYDLNNVFNSNQSGDQEGLSADELADLEAQEEQNVLNYAFRIKLFTMLNEKRMIGVLHNNLGNIHFRAGRYLEAVDRYQESLDILEQINAAESDASDSSKEEQFNETKASRLMNQSLALKKFIEVQQQQGRNFEKVDRLKRNVNLVRDKTPDNNYTRYVKCCCMLAWAARVKDEFHTAQQNVHAAYERLAKVNVSNNSAKEKVYLLQQEIDYEQAMLYHREKKLTKSLTILSQSLVRSEYFELELRKNMISLLVETFSQLGHPLTPGVTELKDRYLKPVTVKRYVLALDYSGSMKYGNKIENSIAALLEIWQKYIRKTDKVSFVRFNLNVEVVFSMEEKGVNTFAKRIAIERSNNPVDRTCLWDALIRSCDLAKPPLRSHDKSYVILICDGDDTSSLKDKETALSKIRDSGVTLIAIGLNLTNDPKTRQMMIEAAKSSKGGMFIDIFENNFEMLFQVVSQHASNKPYADLTHE